MVVLVQEDFMCDGKEPVEVWGGGDSATTIMEFWTMEGYAVGFLIDVAVVPHYEYQIATG